MNVGARGSENQIGFAQKREKEPTWSHAKELKN